MGVQEISVTRPFERAFSRTGLILFRPFSFEKWLVLGFCAFLAHLGEGGFNPASFNWGGGGGGPGRPGQGPDEVRDWVLANLPLIIAIGLIVIAVVVAIALVLMWLNARGRFMLIDGIVRNRGAVVEPWKTYREHAHSYFLFNICLAVAAFAAVLLVLAIAAAIAWPDIQQRRFDTAAISAIVVGALLYLPTVLVLAIVRFLTDHIVVPVIYVRGLRIREAWPLAWEEMIKPNAGPIVLFILMRIVIAIGIVLIASVATCATCCIAALPYIGTVILLPLFVFSQAYTLHFVEEFGPEWQMFSAEIEGEPCPSCGYDLRATPHGCPECGWPNFGAPPTHRGPDGAPPPPPGPTEP